MNWVRIMSFGELDSRGISLVGASTKRRDNSSIGKFGSGLSYSIASLLRQEIKFRIFAGEKEIVVTTKEVNFRGNSFKQVYVDGEPTSITTTMGHENDWNGVWPFTRELISNSLDEDELASFMGVDEVIPVKGHTTFFIEATPDMKKFYTNYSDYLNLDDSKVIHKTAYAKLLPRTALARVFRKGILAMESKTEKSLFTYDLDRVEVNESRVLKYYFECRQEVGIFWEECTNKSLINLWLTGLEGANTGLFEHDCILDSYFDKSASLEFLEVIASHKYISVESLLPDEEDTAKGRLRLPSKLIKRFLAYDQTLDVWGVTTFKNERIYKEVPMSDRMATVIDKALEKLQNTSFGLHKGYPIQSVKFKDKTVKAMADMENKRILVSTMYEHKQGDELALTLIHEACHLESGFDDETREFEHFILEILYNELISN